MKSDLIDVTVCIAAETEKAVKVFEDDPRKAFWLPKSQVEVGETKARGPGGRPVVTVTLPEWLAIEKGLV